MSDDGSVRSVDYREIVHSLSDIVLISDQEGVFVYVSPQVKKVLGYDPDELIGKGAFDYIHPEDLRPAMEALQTAFELGEYHLEYRVKHRDGHYVPFWGTGRIVQEDGNTRIFAHIRDISERKEAENKLGESRNFLDGILSSIQDGISVLDTDLRIIYVNPVMENWYAKEMPLYGKNCYRCYQGLESPCEPCPSLRAMKSKNTESDIVPGPPATKNTWMELYSYPIKEPESGKVTGIIEFVRDISDRVNFKIDLEEANERFNLASDSAGIGIWDLDLVNNDLKWDDWMFRIYGVNREDFSSDYEAWQKGVHSDDFEEANESVRMSIEEDMPFNSKFRIVKPDGEIRWIQANGRVINDENGEPVRMIGTNYDITEEVMVKSLLESEKERAEFYLDLLAHDLGNIHQGISGAIQLLDKRVNDSQMTDLPLGLAKDSVRKALELTRNIMLFSKVRSESPDLEEVDVSTVMMDAFEQVIDLFPGKKISLEKDIRVARVMADPFLKEVFQNLFHNSIRLQDDNPWIRVEVHESGDVVRIEIADKGPGIPEKTKKDLFKRYGIKNNKTRTGLGLSIVKSLVDRYGGTIRVRDRVEGDHSRGVIFIIDLPVFKK